MFVLYSHGAVNAFRIKLILLKVSRIGADRNRSGCEMSLESCIAVKLRIKDD